jgi:hypothetical protein
VDWTLRRANVNSHRDIGYRARHARGLVADMSRLRPEVTGLHAHRERERRAPAPPMNRSGMLAVTLLVAISTTGCAGMVSKFRPDYVEATGEDAARS